MGPAQPFFIRSSFRVDSLPDHSQVSRPARPALAAGLDFVLHLLQNEAGRLRGQLWMDTRCLAGCGPERDTSWPRR